MRSASFSSLTERELFKWLQAPDIYHSTSLVARLLMAARHYLRNQPMITAQPTKCISTTKLSFSIHNITYIIVLIYFISVVTVVVVIGLMMTRRT